MTMPSGIREFDHDFAAAAIVAGALLYAVVQTGDPRIGASAFFALSLSRRWRGRG